MPSILEPMKKEDILFSILL